MFVHLVITVLFWHERCNWENLWMWNIISNKNTNFCLLSPGASSGLLSVFWDDVKLCQGFGESCDLVRHPEGRGHLYVCIIMATVTLQQIQKRPSNLSKGLLQIHAWLMTAVNQNCTTWSLITLEVRVCELWRMKTQLLFLEDMLSDPLPVPDTIVMENSLILQVHVIKSWSLSFRHTANYTNQRHPPMWTETFLCSYHCWKETFTHFQFPLIETVLGPKTSETCYCYPRWDNYN